MLSNICSVCKKRGVATGYSLTKLFHLEDKTQKKAVTKWCHECLKTYAKHQVKTFRNYMPKLRDTNIAKYNETIADVRFIAEIYK